MTKEDTRDVNGKVTSPFVRLMIPKSLLGGIYKITSDKYNKTAISADSVIDTFEIKENRRVSNEGDNIILIKLNKSNLSDRILIKGTTSD